MQVITRSFLEDKLPNQIYCQIMRQRLVPFGLATKEIQVKQQCCSFVYPCISFEAKKKKAF